MYNGVGAINVKGTGLSGYVQRSKAAVSQLSKFRASEYVDDPPSPSSNPLETMRTAKENRELALRLQQHKGLRAIKLRVFLYREERTGLGLPPDVVDRECNTLHETLLRTYMEESSEERRREQHEEDLKNAEKFAAAFKVRPGSIGESFDREQREEERQRAEEERRRALEQKIADRVKRVRRE